MTVRGLFHVFVRAFGLWLGTHSLIVLISTLWQSAGRVEVSGILPAALGLIAGTFFLFRGEWIARRVLGGQRADE